MKTLKKKKKKPHHPNYCFFKSPRPGFGSFERSLVHSCDFNKVDALADSSGVNTQQFF